MDRDSKSKREWLLSRRKVYAEIYGKDQRAALCKMLLTPALNLLLACPKNVVAGTTFGPYRKIRKVDHLYRKFGTFNNFFAKKFRKDFTSGFLRNKHYLLAL